MEKRSVAASKRRGDKGVVFLPGGVHFVGDRVLRSFLVGADLISCRLDWKQPPTYRKMFLPSLGPPSPSNCTLFSWFPNDLFIDFWLNFYRGLRVFCEWFPIYSSILYRMSTEHILSLYWVYLEYVPSFTVACTSIGWFRWPHNG